MVENLCYFAGISVERLTNKVAGPLVYTRANMSNNLPVESQLNLTTEQSHDQKVSLHMGREHASREKKLTMVNFLIFVQKNVSTIRFQEIKIRPLKGFEKMRFLCFYIIGV